MKLPFTLSLPQNLTNLWQRLASYMSKAEQVILAWLVLLLIISGVWSVVGYVNRHTELIAETGGVYREAAVGQPRFLNPVLAGVNDLDVDISQLIYSSLFTFDENLQLQNDLASTYEISEDNKVYTIKIRQDVRWHDGESLTADDIVFTIRSIQTPEYQSPLVTSFQGVTVEKIDEHTVTFTLPQPYAPFLASLTVGILPEHVWQDVAPSNSSLAEQNLKPIGSGPYRFSEITTRRRTGDITELTLVRNNSYYGQHQYLDKIEFSFFPTHDDALATFVRKAVDGIGFLPLQLRDQVEEDEVDIHRLRLPQYFGLFFNQQRNTLLGDAGIRNALSLAINREEIVQEALQTEGEPLHLPIPPGVFAFNEELVSPTANIERAIQNLEEAGWHDEDQNGIREKDDQELRVAITTTDWPEYIHTAKIVQEQWRAIGVEAEVVSVGAGTIQQSIIRPREYDVLLFGEILSAQPDPYPFWHSTQIESPGLNFALFSNPEVDEILEEARITLDLEERAQKYRQFQGIILDLKPAIILYRPYYLFATEGVRGVNVNHASLTADRFNNIESWHVKTKRVWRGN